MNTLTEYAKIETVASISACHCCNTIIDAPDKVGYLYNIPYCLDCFCDKVNQELDGATLKRNLAPFVDDIKNAIESLSNELDEWI